MVDLNAPSFDCDELLKDPLVDSAVVDQARFLYGNRSLPQRGCLGFFLFTVAAADRQRQTKRGVADPDEYLQDPDTSAFLYEKYGIQRPSFPGERLTLY